MESGFQDELANWVPFYGFVGTAAATLLGLLFVAVSLRLNIFRDARTADLRDFARLTLFSLVAPLVISGLSLMPHEQPLMLAVPLFVIAAVGLAGSMYFTWEWVQLNPRQDRPTRGPSPRQLQGWVYIVSVGLMYVVVAIGGVLLLLGNDLAFGFVGAAEGAMLLSGTFNAWVMLSNAGNTPEP
jgi:hypothetical protein